MHAEPCRSPGCSQRPSAGPGPPPGGARPLAERGPGQAVSPAVAEQWLVSARLVPAAASERAHLGDGHLPRLPRDGGPDRREATP